MERVMFTFSMQMDTYMQIHITKAVLCSFILKVEMLIQEISPVFSNAMDVGSSLSESEKILSKYVELDIQAKVNAIRIIIMVMIL